MFASAAWIARKSAGGFARNDLGAPATSALYAFAAATIAARAPAFVALASDESAFVTLLTAADGAPPAVSDAPTVAELAAEPFVRRLPTSCSAAVGICCP